jgi:K+-sensing histidine kinase KdpD
LFFFFFFLKDKIFNSISHNLKTPLNAITLIANIIAMDRKGVDLEQNCEDILRNAEILNKMIE